MSDSDSRMGEDTSVWVTACAVADLPPGEMQAIACNPPAAVYNVDGEFYATADTCTHMKSSLTEGYLDGDQVECILHAATFCVRNGKATSLPATVALRTFETRVDGEHLQVLLPAECVVSAGTAI